MKKQLLVFLELLTVFTFALLATTCGGGGGGGDDDYSPKVAAAPVSLPKELLQKEDKDNTYTVGRGNIKKAGTIFSVFAEGGYFTLTETEIEGNVHFDMGIPVDASGKPIQFVYHDEVDTEKFFRYVQFTSESGEISALAADNFLSTIEFHKIEGQPIYIRVNLESVPIEGEDDEGNSYKLNENVFYLDGSFYRKSERFGDESDGSDSVTWPQAYNAAKEAPRFNGMQGYLMTITSDAENKFVYDQIFKAEKEQAGMTSDDFGSWIGGTRVKPKADESAEPSEASDSETNAGANANPNENESSEPVESPAYDYDANTWPQTQDEYKWGYRDDWVWACGPEAGKVFYTNKVYVTNQNYRADGMYSSWSNDVDCALNGLTNKYKDKEPNSQVKKEDGRFNGEYYTQYTGLYIWNDGHEKGPLYRQKFKDMSNRRWLVHYYVIEYSPYKNMATGEDYAKKLKYPKLYAEQTYN